MPYVRYVTKNFGAASLAVIDQANDILVEYEAQGFDLTLRQLYYQFVSRDLIPNRQSEYKRLGSIVNDARLAGLIDWKRIVDRTRELEEVPHWDDPQDILNVVAKQFRIDKWERQPSRVEVWIEKDALVGVIEGVCKSLDVPFLSCRGYTSQSEMWGSAMRMVGQIQNGQPVTVLHLGDHDPSGIDMSRDIEDRLRMFIDGHVDLRNDDGDSVLHVDRIALNMDQVRRYGPPPNPAKITDSRFHGYMLEHGRESWELDALEPQVLATLIRRNVEALRDDEIWGEDVEREARERELLGKTAQRWDEVEALVS